MATDAAAHTPAARLVVLSETGSPKPYATRYATRPPHKLRGNPLFTRNSWSTGRGGRQRGEAAATLQDLIRQRPPSSAAKPPQEAKLYRALYHTYIEPAPTQEAAAEHLDLPFSTYRRHLKSGVTRVAGILWQWEIQGAGA